MKALKIIGIVLGSIVGVVIILVLVAWFLLSRGSAIAKDITPVLSNHQSAQELDTKWADFKTTVNNAKPGTEVTVTLTEEEVNSKLNEQIKTVKMPDGLSMSNLNVNLKDGKLLISADIGYSVFKGTASMEAEVENENGQAKIDVTNIDMGKLPIPQALKNQLTDMIPSDGVVNMSNLPFSLETVQIVDGQMVIKGVTK